MKLLIIGGSGFLSGTIAREALNAGHDVWAVTRGQRGVANGVHAIVADRKDRAAFAKAVADAGQSWDLVIDSIGFTAEDARQDLDAFSARVKHLCFISTDFVYGRPRPWQIDESWDGFETDYPYGRGKREAEVILMSAAGSMRVTVLRPCHIYGPGSQLGCLPEHGRDPRLTERLLNAEPIRLVGGGHFLQQPVFAPDLARMAISCPQRTGDDRDIFHAAGPEVVESRTFYEQIARELGVPCTIEEVSIASHLAAHPASPPFLCHRVYSMKKAEAAGFDVPATPLADGLARHVHALRRT